MNSSRRRRWGGEHRRLGWKLRPVIMTLWAARGTFWGGWGAWPKRPLRTPAKGGRHHHFQARPRRSYYDDPKRLNFRVRMGSGALLLVWSRSLVCSALGYMFAVVTRRTNLPKKEFLHPPRPQLLHCGARNVRGGEASVLQGGCIEDPLSTQA